MPAPESCHLVAKVHGRCTLTLALYALSALAHAQVTEPDSATPREVGNPAFSASECDAVERWVRNGGALLLIADPRLRSKLIPSPRVWPSSRLPAMAPTQRPRVIFISALMPAERRVSHWSLVAVGWSSWGKLHCSQPRS